MPVSKEKETAVSSPTTTTFSPGDQRRLLMSPPGITSASSPKKMGSEVETAISFRKAHKHYGRGGKKVAVLLGLDMTIPKGAIYGLLGPSGCGKTTLLQCIVGKKRLKSGEVVVFGGSPGSAEAGVPGSRVGYMPQELALYGEFTIAETLQYFGRIFNLSKAMVEERTQFLLAFLDLPKGKRLIMNLSGGQQRRASLAAALLHEPELLILDEPTVGVDPLLRQCIWTHLLEISKSSKLKTTIVVTTHYIEEARQANVVGMMRFGKLLAEGHPDSLLELYERPTLEDVFLHLCLGDETERDMEKAGMDALNANGPGQVNDMEEGKCDDKIVENIPMTNGHIAAHPMTNGHAHPITNGHIVAANSSQNGKLNGASPGMTQDTPRPTYYVSNPFFSCHRFTALLLKNFIKMWRNIAFLIFQFIIPTVQVSLFCLAIGRDPRGMTMAVVNEDIITRQCEHYTYGCLLGDKNDVNSTVNHRENVSCRFLSYVDPAILTPVYFDNMEDAIRSVKKGSHWGVMHFKKNFTNALYARIFGLIELQVPDNATLDESDIHVSMDMTNQQIGYTIQLRLSEAYQRFSSVLLDSCQIPSKLSALPIIFEKPIFGSNAPTFTEFMAPGIIISITYFMAVGLTALSFITERKEGLLDRSWVAGVTATEVMLAYVVAQFVVMVVQVTLVLVFMINVFKVPAEGPMVWIVLLTILQGICGMAFGLLISAIGETEQDAIQLALASFYPNLLLSGIIWPLEGMPDVLRYISYALPQTYACEAMRGILSRGWGLEWMQVYRGYLVTIAWTVGLLILSAVLLKIRR